MSKSRKSEEICKVSDCDERVTLVSVLCEYHAREYYRWRKRVDLSAYQGESTCDFWLRFGNVPIPPRPLRKGHVVVYVVALLLDDDDNEIEAPPSLRDCDREKLRALSVRVPGQKLWKEFAGEVVFGEDEDGPCRYQAVDGWYASWEDAQGAIGGEL